MGSDEFQDSEVGSVQEVLQRTVMIGETVEAVDGGGDFSFEKTEMGLIKEKEEGEEELRKCRESRRHKWGPQKS